MSNYPRKLISPVFLGIVCVLTVIAYGGALRTPFWGDDYINLDGLRFIANEGYSQYVFSGVAGPAGRFLALLTFALQHASWPSDSFSFKLVNLGIHLLNGILVYLVANRLAVVMGSDTSGRSMFPLVASALWLLHPLQITTVLYVVQRMTQLAALFSLSGLYFYLRYRDDYRVSGNLGALVGMSLSVGIGIVFGVLSKETGILLPLYILILECTVLHNRDMSALHRWWTNIVLIIPLVLTGCYLALDLDAMRLSYQMRHFTMSERLLTEIVVLFDYLAKIFLPQPGIYSVFNDDFPIAKGLLSPPITIIYAIGMAGLIVLGIHWRKMRPVIACSIFWFLGGHVLESSFLPLEIYFEHRNYLPILGPCLLIAWFIVWLYNRYGVFLGAGAGILLVSMVSSITYRETASYINPYTKAMERASMQPLSVRAWSNLMDLQMVINDYDRFTETYRQITHNQNHALLLDIKNVHFTACHFQREVPEGDWNSLVANLELDDWYPNGTIGALDDMVKSILNRGCVDLNPYRVIHLLVRFTALPKYAPYRGMFHELAALMCVHVGDADCALANIATAIAFNPNPNRHELQLKLFIGLGRKTAAQTGLVAYGRFLNANPRLKLAYKDSMAMLTDQISRLKDDPRAD